MFGAGSTDAVELLRERVAWCEAEEVSLVCFPEAILGGLADDCDEPVRVGIRVDGGQLETVLRPLASTRVTSIVGFTELAGDGSLYNAAAVFHRGRVAGIYRKLHPAIRRSVYAAGSQMPVFPVGPLKFGIVICNDSNFPAAAKRMAAQGASILFIPTNNGLPREHDAADVAKAARNADVGLTRESGIWVVRADVAGQDGRFASYGSSEIVDPAGMIVQEAQPFAAGTLAWETADSNVRRHVAD